MIVFRQGDARGPLFWEGSGQPAGRFHTAADGPVHYFADTPDGAWAELLRDEEIRDPADLATIRRAIWAIEIGDEPIVPVPCPHAPDADRAAADAEPAADLTTCQAAARALRAAGHSHLSAPSLALEPSADPGQPAPRVIVVFGEPSALRLTAWMVAADASPPAGVLSRVRYS